MIVGTILSVAGLALFLHAGDTPTGGFPDGSVTADKVLGFESNGWTAWITTAAGVLLLFGAAQHLLAKAMSLIVGLALAACAVIALIDGDVLGLAAANWAVELGWGIAAVILLLNLFAPRVDRSDRVDDHDHHRRFGLHRHDGHDGRAERVRPDAEPTGRSAEPVRPDAEPTGRGTEPVRPDEPARGPSGGQTRHGARG